MFNLLLFNAIISATLKQYKQIYATQRCDLYLFNIFIIIYLWANLDFPQCFAAGGRSSRLPASGSEKNILLLPVVVTCEELLLLCMEQPDYITL